MNVENWLKRTKKRIDALDAELIAVNVFPEEMNADRSWLVTHMKEKIDKEYREMADEMVCEREKGVPLAYIFEEKEFYGREFRVSPGVLIPRPETETLIDLVKELPLSKTARILDVGTGSGCIAVTLALEIPQAQVMATDVSTDALNVARRNDLSHEARVEFEQMDLLSEFDLNEPEVFDVVVANLPYVNPNWEWLDLAALEFEPIEALFALRENGLSLYRRMFEQLKEGRVKAKFLVLEADPCQHEDLVKLARSYRWKLKKKEGYGLVFVSSKR